MSVLSNTSDYFFLNSSLFKTLIHSVLLGKIINFTYLSSFQCTITISMVETSGIEPLTSCVQSRRSPIWAKPPFLKESGRQDSNLRPLGPKPSALPSWATSRKTYAPKGSRTPNLLIRSQTLYPVELWVLFSIFLHLPSSESVLCRGPESNRYGDHSPQDFKSCASASSATPAFVVWLD